MQHNKQMQADPAKAGPLMRGVRRADEPRRLIRCDSHSGGVHELGHHKVRVGLRIVSMATIADTLNDLPPLQTRIQGLFDVEEPLDRQFLGDVMNFTSVYYFSLLSHACLDDPHLKQANSPIAKKYYELFANPTMLEEYIRWQNIGGLFSIWVTFEKFVFRCHRSFSSKRVEKFEDAHDLTLKKWGIKSDRRKEIRRLISGIRRTRNCLHDDGIYTNQDRVDFSFTLAGEQYVLEPGKPVRPLRVIPLVKVMLDHYEELAAAKASSS